MKCMYEVLAKRDGELEEILGKLKKLKVAILGGTDRWIKRMKKLLPDWSFVGVGEGTGSMLALERADYIYIYTGALKHRQYYQAMNIIKRDNKMLFYLGSTNTDECLRQFYKDLYGANRE